MEAFIQVILKLMKSRDMENINGLMAKHTKENGRKIRCTVTESYGGEMAKNMKATLLMISETVKEGSSGETAESTTALGKTASSMELASLSIKKA